MLKKTAEPGSRSTANDAAPLAAFHAARVSLASRAAAATLGSESRSTAPRARSRATAAAFASLLGAAVFFATAISLHSSSSLSAPASASCAALTSAARTTRPDPSAEGASTRGSNTIRRVAPKLTLTTNDPSSRSVSLSPCAPMASKPSRYRLTTAWLHVCPHRR